MATVTKWIQNTAQCTGEVKTGSRLKIGSTASVKVAPGEFQLIHTRNLCIRGCEDIQQSRDVADLV